MAMLTDPRPPLRVIAGDRARLIDDIESVAESLRELEARLASAREEMRRLLAGVAGADLNDQ